jgi:hypothetical protein
MIHRRQILSLFGAAGLLGGSRAASAQPRTARPFNGLTTGVGDLYRLSQAKTRSVSPENFTGEKGRGAMATEGTGAKAARDLGVGWKISPSVHIEPGQTFTLADIKGPGAVQHIWMTPTGHWRHSILRIYWDGEAAPSVESPVGDFFASGWGTYAQISSAAVAVNPGSAFNCYWVMPFRRSCRITMENVADERMTLYYQVDHALTDIPDDAAYLHAQFLSWGVNNKGWWGEGEIKFYIDGDTDHPTICGTGTEDYFCGSYNFENQETKRYQEFTAPYSGLPLVIRPDGLYESQQRFGLYRWHIIDPIRFSQDLRVTIQALGWHTGGRYLPLQDDIASVAYWYQTEPHASFAPLPSKDQLEIV